MTKPSTSVVNLRLDTPTIESIRAVAVEEGRTWAGQVRYILAGWLRAREGKPERAADSP